MSDQDNTDHKLYLRMSQDHEAAILTRVRSGPCISESVSGDIQFKGMLHCNSLCPLVPVVSLHRTSLQYYFVARSHNVSAWTR